MYFPLYSAALFSLLVASRGRSLATRQVLDTYPHVRHTLRMAAHGVKDADRLTETQQEQQNSNAVEQHVVSHGQDALATLTDGHEVNGELNTKNGRYANNFRSLASVEEASTSLPAVHIQIPKDKENSTPNKTVISIRPHRDTTLGDQSTYPQSQEEDDVDEEEDMHDVYARDMQELPPSGKAALLSEIESVTNKDNAPRQSPQQFKIVRDKKGLEDFLEEGRRQVLEYEARQAKRNRFYNVEPFELKLQGRIKDTPVVHEHPADARKVNTTTANEESSSEFQPDDSKNTVISLPNATLGKYIEVKVERGPVVEMEPDNMTPNSDSEKSLVYSMDASSKPSRDVSSERSHDIISETLPVTSTELFSEASTEPSPKPSFEASTELSSETLPAASTELPSEAATEPSSEASFDASTELSSEASTEPSSEVTAEQENDKQLPQGSMGGDASVSHQLMIPSVMGVKPFVSDTMKGNFFKLVPYTEAKELCTSVLESMNQDATTSQYAYLVFNILVSLDHSTQSKSQEAVQADKETLIALDELYQKSLFTLQHDTHVLRTEEFKTSSRTLSYVDRLSECIADPATGRTIYQKLIELGMRKSFNSVFVKSILSQKSATGYDPSIALDKDGNTLLHLAAISNSTSILTELIERHGSLQIAINTDPASSGTEWYWVITCLDHKNNNGSTVLDMAGTSGLRARIKRIFRSLVLFLRKSQEISESQVRHNIV